MPNYTPPSRGWWRANYYRSNNMSRKIRILLGLLILLLSISLLIWGLLPARHEIRTLPISPSDLQLPTPSSFYFDAPGEFHAGRFNASLIKLVEGS